MCDVGGGVSGEKQQIWLLEGQSSLSPSGGGCWGREAPHELAGKRPQGAGAHVNEETAAAAPAIQPPSSSFPSPPTTLPPSSPWHPILLLSSSLDRDRGHALQKEKPITLWISLN